MMSIIILSEEKMTWIMGQFMCKGKYMCAKGKFIKYKLHKLNANMMIWLTSIMIDRSRSCCGVQHQWVWHRSFGQSLPRRNPIWLQGNTIYIANTQINNNLLKILKFEPIIRKTYLPCEERIKWTSGSQDR